MKHLIEKKVRLRNLKKQIEQNNGEAIGTVDPDARIMRTNGEGRVLDACYNIQAIADHDHGLVTMFEVTTDANDSGKLSLMT